jgi:glyoxylase-like metal-dependent hydrolase (beta-lactamase superfamily II)
MDEILPGIFHWTAFHEGIGMDVSSYYVEDSGTLLDPMLSAEGIGWFRERRAPERIVLTIRHHYRHSGAFAEEFGIEVWCHEDGLHEFEGGPDVRGYSAGDTLAPGIEALDLVGLSPDDTALRIDAAGGVLAFGDALVNYGGGRVGFVPDDLIGDDPEAIKRDLRASLERLLQQDFDHLFFAHGEPIVGGGRRALEQFLS